VAHRRRNGDKSENIRTHSQKEKKERKTSMATTRPKPGPQTSEEEGKEIAGWDVSGYGACFRDGKWHQDLYFLEVHFHTDLEEARRAIKELMEEMEFEHSCTGEEGRLSQELQGWQGESWDFELDKAPTMQYPDLKVSVRPCFGKLVE
jgi:hypothetical protein